MKVNKKFIFFAPVLIALALFIGLYVFFNREDSNSFTASERRWLQENSNIRKNIEVINDYPIYGNGGVFDKFISSLEEATGLEFNTVPYYRGATTKSNDFKFKVIKEESELTSNDLILNEDVYVVIGKNEKKINQISDFEDVAFGVLNDDVGDISYYLKRKESCL